MMPMEPGGEQHIVESDASLSEDTYTITATPGSGWYGAVFGQMAGDAIGDTAGVPVSLSLATVVSGGNITLNVAAGSSSTGTEEGQFSLVDLSITGINAN